MLIQGYFKRSYNPLEEVKSMVYNSFLFSPYSKTMTWDLPISSRITLELMKAHLK